MDNDKETIDKLIEYCREKPGAYEARPFGPSPICFKVSGKIFAQLNPEKSFYKFTIKCEPDRGLMYRDIYPGIVVRGFHTPAVQQPYWNTVDMDLFDDMDALLNMIDEAYDAVIRKLTKRERAYHAENSQLIFQECDSSDEDYQQLCRQGAHAGDEPASSAGTVIVAYRSCQLVGCASFAGYDAERAELGSIHVDQSRSGTGLEAELTRRIEATAKLMGYRSLFIEAGKLSEEIRLMYKGLGYRIAENYGQYSAGSNESAIEAGELYMVKRI